MPIVGFSFHGVDRFASLHADVVDEEQIIEHGVEFATLCSVLTLLPGLLLRRLLRRFRATASAFL